VISLRSDLSASTTQTGGQLRALNASGYLAPSGIYFLDIDLSVDVSGEELTKSYRIPLIIQAVIEQEQELENTIIDEEET